MIHTNVARILSPTHIILSAGSQHGVREGMVFAIYDLGEPIIDPETLESLGQLEVVKGRVKVFHVQEKFCQASTFSHTKNPLRYPLKPTDFLPDEWRETTVFEQLKVDSALAVETDLTVRVGDKARSLE